MAEPSAYLPSDFSNPFDTSYKESRRATLPVCAVPFAPY